MIGPEFVDEENRVELLTGLSECPPGAGRPSELTDEGLMRAARNFQHVLEQNWGTVGKSLKFAKTISDIRDAFRQVQGTDCSDLEFFTRTETRRSDANTLRKLRKRLQQTREELYKASVAQRYARDWYQRAQDDWANEQDAERKQKLETACTTWRWKSQDAVGTADQLETDRNA